MRSASPFTTVAAVESWDTWFRWRDSGGLRDRTIETTWWRVARAIAAAEAGQAEEWSRRFFEAFAQWRLLPDETLLRCAGTLGDAATVGPLTATVNAAAFARGPGSRFDFAGLADAAALAVRLLDDARPSAAAAGGRDEEIRVGLLGMGDALEELGLDYDSAAARNFAGDVASALAHGALRGSVELARERGARAGAPDANGPVPKVDAALADDLHRWGGRFARLTAIAPQPRLARLANAASDALDPSVRTPASLVSQLRMRAAAQPWIDAPIDYPLALSGERSGDQVEEASRFAQSQGIALPALVPVAAAATAD